MEQKAAYKAEFRKGMPPQIDRETAFFKSIGLRQDTTTYGHQARFDKRAVNLGG